MVKLNRRVILGCRTNLGLGDCLQYSTLPELYYQNGIDCYIYYGTIYRNDEIKELVWGLNPFVKGYSLKEPNVGTVEFRGRYVNGASSSVDLAEYWHGFGFKNHLPKIYYQPKLKKSFVDKKIIDFSAITANKDYNVDVINKFLNGIFDKENYLFTQSKKNKFNYNFVNGIDVYEFNDIFEYTDLIYSCKEFNCLHSGCAVLAAAVGRFKIDIKINCYLPNDKSFYYPMNTSVNWFDGYYFNNTNHKYFESC
jgi:hypothetical protein